MEVAALLLVLFAKTDNHGVYADYTLKFPTMKMCLDSVKEAKFTVPSAENETTISYICVPDQKVVHTRYPT